MMISPSVECMRHQRAYAQLLTMHQIDRRATVSKMPSVSGWQPGETLSHTRARFRRTPPSCSGLLVPSWTRISLKPLAWRGVRAQQQTVRIRERPHLQKHLTTTMYARVRPPRVANAGGESRFPPCAASRVPACGSVLHDAPLTRTAARHFDWRSHPRELRT